jgi:hypothetical protein
MLEKIIGWTAVAVVFAITIAAFAFLPWLTVTVVNWFLPVAQQLHFMFWQYLVMGVLLSLLQGAVRSMLGK